ncbi:MAG TPA: adenylate kinase [Clostridiales bacterium]|nr:adenylate kinase [Clostridiales bacterium]
MIIILMGAPGVGKGTQSLALSEKLRIPHIAVGDILRKHIKEETDIGKEVGSIMKQGLLVSDITMFDIINQRIHDDDCKNGFILDGFPRTISQADGFERLLTDVGRRITVVFNIESNYKILLDRIKGRIVCKNCGATYHNVYHKPQLDGYCDICEGIITKRKDDTEEIFNSRIEEYNQQTKPLIGFYQQRGILINIDSNDVKENITERLLKHLGANI